MFSRLTAAAWTETARFFCGVLFFERKMNCSTNFEHVYFFIVGRYFFFLSIDVKLYMRIFLVWFELIRAISERKLKYSFKA